jgi:hypothetical protein
MLTPTLYLLPLLPFITAIPLYIRPNTTTTMLPRALPQPGSCPDTSYPLESAFTNGYTQFCTTYVHTNPPTSLRQSDPLLATFDLPNPSGSIAKWVFRIQPTTSMIDSYSYETTSENCIEYFSKFLETDEAGGLGKSYCVVDGTGGDKIGNEGMSGQGVVSVLGGSVEQKKLGPGGLGTLVFETYRRGSRGAVGTARTEEDGKGECGARFCGSGTV